MPLIPALWRQRQVVLSEFEASLVYKVSFTTARADTQRNPVSKTKQNKTKKECTMPIMPATCLGSSGIGHRSLGL